jgi:pyruvate ferredoxin oxidoreductase gamma subunit
MWPFRAKTKNAKRSLVAVRMEAIGGQGANSAGKILAEAAVLGMGYTGNHFSSFGSEKRGTPVKSYIRFSPAGQAIRSATAIQHPDLLIIFHELLLTTHPECLAGVGPNTDILINSASEPTAIRFPQGIKLRRVGTVDATTIAMKNKCGLNVVMLGAATFFLPEIEEGFVSNTITGFFTKLGAEGQKRNLRGFAGGRRKLQSEAFTENQGRLSADEVSLPTLGYLNAPLGGAIINPGNSILKNNSASRKGTLPRFIKEACFNCGLCDMVCPDYCFVWNKDPGGLAKPELLGIDYQYCKACQKCIVACPVQALVLYNESDLPEDETQIKLFPQPDVLIKKQE